MRSFFRELRRRQIPKAIGAYGLVAWLFTQIGTATFPVMRLPDWTTGALVILLVLAFPVALFMAWTHDDRVREIDVICDRLKKTSPRQQEYGQTQADDHRQNK